MKDNNVLNLQINNNEFSSNDGLILFVADNGYIKGNLYNNNINRNSYIANSLIEMRSGNIDIKLNGNKYIDNTCVGACIGGMLYFSNPTTFIKEINKIVVSNEVFLRNGGSIIAGGGVFINLHDVQTVVNVKNSIFDGNFAIFGKGGAIGVGCSHANMQININNCTFNKNNADAGGSIAFFYVGDETNMEISIKNSLFTSNGATLMLTKGIGGGISIEGDSIDANNINNKENVKEFNNENKFLLSISNVVGNENNGYEGGFLCVKGNYNSKNVFVSIKQSNFTNNFVYVSGGVLVASDAFLSIEKCIFEENFAIYEENYERKHTNSNDLSAQRESEYSGAVLLSSFAYIDVIDSVFTNNLAYNNGGAIFSRKDLWLKINNSIFFENVANNAGGSFFIHDSSNIYIDKSSAIYENEATYGGGLYISSIGIQKYSILSNVERNVANGGGGVYYGEGELYNFESVKNNKAVKCGDNYLTRPVSYIFDETKDNSCFLMDEYLLLYNCTLSSISLIDYYEQEFFIDSFEEVHSIIKIEHIEVNLLSTQTRNINFIFTATEKMSNEAGGFYEFEGKISVLKFTFGEEQKKSLVKWIVLIVSLPIILCMCLCFLILVFIIVLDYLAKRRKENKGVQKHYEKL